jgi:hypothetical protein
MIAVHRASSYTRVVSLAESLWICYRMELSELTGGSETSNSAGDKIETFLFGVGFCQRLQLRHDSMRIDTVDIEVSGTAKMSFTMNQFVCLAHLNW